MKELQEVLKKNYVQEGIEQSKKDAQIFLQMFIGGICGATLVIALIGFTVSPESAHHLVECWRNLVGN
mgnify:CR=1 FL=1